MELLVHVLTKLLSSRKTTRIMESLRKDGAWYLYSTEYVFLSNSSSNG